MTLYRNASDFIPLPTIPLTELANWQHHRSRGWALEAPHERMSFGSGFGAVLLPLGVLLGFLAAANLLAARFFRS